MNNFKRGIRPKSECLRKQTEEVLRMDTFITDWQLSGAGASKLIHEIELLKVELNLKNDEIKLLREQTKAASKKSDHMRDSDSSGQFTLSREGDLIDPNFTTIKQRNILLFNKLLQAIQKGEK
jgi:hypothetical protein